MILCTFTQICLTSWFLLTSYASSITNPVPATDRPRPCQSATIRREWRDLSSQQKLRYIAAVKCLQTLPAQSSFKGVKTRFDDFQALHVSLMTEVHLVGQFLPWHRRLINVYETAMREECGHTEGHPYWDWTRDVDHTNTYIYPANLEVVYPLKVDFYRIAKSPVFHPTDGFGGNGIEIPGYSGIFGNFSDIPGWTGGGCVVDGPFASYNLSIGPGTLVTNHCLTRSFNTHATSFIRSSQVANATRQPTFERFRIELEGTPLTPSFKIHDAGHLAVGGELWDRWSSPGDPLFYLHHSNLDRIWWLWEFKELKNRLKDISGRTRIDPPSVNATLDFKLKMGELAPTIRVRDVMDIRGDPLCYDYV